MTLMNEIEDGGKAVEKVGRRLRPPKSNDEEVAAWRWFVVVMLTLNSCAIIIFVMLAYGMTPISSGFAYASETKDNRRMIVSFRAEQVGWRMFDIRVEQCGAMSKGLSAQAYTVQLDELAKLYMEVTARAMILPRCQELL